MLDDRFFVSKGPLTIADIIEGLEVTLPDPKFLDENISCLASLEDAKPGSIVFLSSKKFLRKLKECKATACFVPEELSQQVSKHHIVPIISKNPRAHFARVMSLLVEHKTLKSTSGPSKIASSAKIHKSAVIGAGAVIGNNSVVGPNSVIGPGVEMGEACEIAANVTVEATIMGDNVVVKPGAVIGSRGFGVDRDEQGVIDIPHFGRVILGNNVQVGANSCIDRGQLKDTVLAEDVKLDNLVQIGHNVQICEGSRLAAQVGVSGSCKIGKNVMIGGGAAFADHLDIGDDVFIAARSGVMNSIPAGEYWGGTPAQPMKAFMREVATVRKLSRKTLKKISNET